MQAFYLNALLRSLVLSMVGIFTPLYIYQLSLPIVESSAKAVALVGAFYLVVRGTTFVWDIVIAKVIERIGFRWSVVTSVGLLALYLFVLMGAEKTYFLLLPAALMLGIMIPFYWIARNSVIAIDSKKGELGKQIGWLSVLERVAGVLGPLAAGLMIERWGFPVLYSVSGMILVASLLPLFSMPHHVHRNGVSWRGYKEWLVGRRFFHQSVGVVAKAMDEYGMNIVWPLVIFLMGVHYSTLGGVFSAITVLSIVLRYGSGRLFDKLYHKRGLEDEVMFGVAAVGTAGGWVARLFVGSVGGVVLVDTLSTIFGTTWRNVGTDYEMLGGKRMHEIAYFTYREMIFSLAAMGVCVMWVVGAWYGIWRELIFGSTALWVLLSIVQARESNLR